MDPARRLDAASTALVVDSSSDVPADRRPANWRVVPIPVTVGATTYADGIDLDASTFYALLERADRMPTTSQPSPGLMREAIAGALAEYESAVVLPLSARMSGTVETARAAARELGEDRVLVLESGSVTVALGLLALRLQARLEAGVTAGELSDALARLRRDHRAVFSLETLEYLERGGRIGRAQAVAGSLLRVRPILQIADGEVAPYARVRGAHRVLPAMEDFLLAHSAPDRPLHVALGHTRRPEALPELRSLVARVRPLASIDLESEIGPTVGTHAGPGAFVIAFVADAD